MIALIIICTVFLLALIAIIACVMYLGVATTIAIAALVISIIICLCVTIGGTIIIVRLIKAKKETNKQK